jgi:hypothetical protein
LIVQTISGRAHAIKEAQKDRSQARQPDDVVLLENEVQALRTRTKTLEALMFQTKSAEERSKHLAEYLTAMELLRQKDQELFDKRLGNNRAVFDDAYNGAVLGLRGLGEDALLAAAQAIGEDLPDDLSVWTYRLSQLKYRAGAFWGDLTTRHHTQLEVILKLIGAAKDLAEGELMTMLEIVLLLGERGVNTPEDVAALLGQRESVQRVLDALQLQNRHLEPLLAASNLRPQ